MSYASRKVPGLKPLPTVPLNPAMMKTKLCLDMKPKLFALCLACTLLSPLLSAQTTDEAAQRAHLQVQEMQQVEDAWDTAIAKRDQFGLENVMSPQIIDIAATGDVTTRNQNVARLYAKDAVPASMTQTVVDVREFGPALRIVNGTYVMHWIPTIVSKSTPAVDEKGVFTHVFQSVNGRWLCVNSQRTVVAEQQNSGKKSQTKKSVADSMHLPPVYKGAAESATTPAPVTKPN